MALGAYYIKAIALIKNKVLNYQNISYSCLDKLKGIILHLINNNHKLNENNFLLQQTLWKIFIKIYVKI